MKKTNRIRLFFCVTVLLCFAAYYGSYSYVTRHMENDKTKDQQLSTEITDPGTSEQKQEVNPVSSLPAASWMYLLKENDGYVTVYETDGETLYDETDIPLERLSSQLQEEVRLGKPIYTQEELYNFLEDHTS